MPRMAEKFHGTGEVGLTDYVNNGILHKQVPADSVMVNSSSELASIKDNYTPGVIAYTAGFADMWQLSASGEWVSIM